MQMESEGMKARDIAAYMNVNLTEEDKDKFENIMVEQGFATKGPGEVVYLNVSARGAMMMISDYLRNEKVNEFIESKKEEDLNVEVKEEGAPVEDKPVEERHGEVKKKRSMASQLRNRLFGRRSV